MKKIILFVLSSALTLMTACINNKVYIDMLSIQDIGLPTDCTPGYAKGVSAPFCGTVEGRFITAGGANFPDKPVIEGGVKKYYNDILCLENSQWSKVGEMPLAAAYGGSMHHNGKLYLVGGNDGTRTMSEVYSVALTDGRFEIKEETAMPAAVEQAGYACDGQSMYVFGGLTAGGTYSKVLEGKEVNGTLVWTEMADMPESLVQPIAMAVNGRLYVWGGFDPATGSIPLKGWCMDKGDRQWREIQGAPDGQTFVGASAAAADGRLAVIGGVNNDVFAWGISIASAEDRYRYMTMEPSEYRFNRKLRVFDPETEEWSVPGEAEALALAGAGFASDGEYLYVLGGELKPGVRTPKAWKLKINW